MKTSNHCHLHHVCIGHPAPTGPRYEMPCTCTHAGMSEEVAR